MSIGQNATAANPVEMRAIQHPDLSERAQADGAAVGRSSDSGHPLAHRRPVATPAAIAGSLMRLFHRL